MTSSNPLVEGIEGNIHQGRPTIWQETELNNLCEEKPHKIIDDHKIDTFDDKQKEFYGKGRKCEEVIIYDNEKAEVIKKEDKLNFTKFFDSPSKTSIDYIDTKSVRESNNEDDENE